MPKLVVELESCTVVFPEGFDANQWLINCYLEDRRYQESMAGQRTVTMPAPKQRRKAISETTQKYVKNTDF